MRTNPVPQSVYDAALRHITRDELPDDAARLNDWNRAESVATLREIALEVIRQAADRGIARECVR